MKALVLGYHNMGCIGLDALLRNGFEVPAVFTHRDNPNEEVWWDSLAERAEKAGISVHYPESARDPKVAELIASYEPDFLFSFYFRFMIPKEILTLAPRGALNLHGSLLPRYRGRAPVNWVLVNGEKETGVSLHYMVEKPDAGNLVDQEAVPIAFDETPRTLYAKLEEAAVKVLDRALPLLKEGTAPARPLDLSQGSYYGGRKPEDGRVDWNQSATRLFFLVRGVTHPYPGAFTFFSGRKVFVWWAWPEELESEAPAGTVLAASAKGVAVAAGQGQLRLLRLQAEGEPEYDAYTFSTLHGLLPGAKLGEER